MTSKISRFSTRIDFSGAIRSFKRQFTGFELRPYQQECVDTVLERLKFQRRAAVSLPTGSGKTVVFSRITSLVKPLPGQGSKTLIITNRRELCYQTAHTLQKMYPQTTVALEIGSKRYVDQRDSEICVASIASISRDGRLDQFDPQQFKLIIIDEAHHSAAATYKKVAAYFGVDRPDCNIYLVGFSATFFRHDLRPLSHFFDDVFFHRHVQSMIESDHLCRAKVTNVRAFGGMLEGNERSRRENHVLKTEEGVDLIVNLWKEHSQYNSTVIFAMDIEQAEKLVARFRDNGLDCRAVHGNMRGADRDLVISSFRERKFPIIVNCGVLTEGTDIPCIDQVILARPIASVGLAMQMIGRGLRLYPGKDHCHVIQLVEFTNYADAVDLGPLLAGIEPQKRLGHNAQGRTDLDDDATELQDIELHQLPEYEFNDIFKSDYQPRSPRESPLVWIPHQKRWYLFGPPGAGSRHFRIIKEVNKEERSVIWKVQQGLKIPIKGKAFKVWKYYDKADCDSISDAVKAAENLAKNNWGEDGLRYVSKNASWRNLDPTAKQIQLLKRDKAYAIVQELCPNITRGVATTLINFKVLNCNIKPGLVRAAM